jgi:hypothetical protein
MGVDEVLDELPGLSAAHDAVDHEPLVSRRVDPDVQPLTEAVAGVIDGAASCCRHGR